MRENERSIEALQKAIDLNEKVGNYQNVAAASMYIGFLYGDKGVPQANELSLHFFRKALKYYKKIGDWKQAESAWKAMQALFVKARSLKFDMDDYFEASEIYEQLGDWFQVRYDMNTLLEICKTSGDLDGQAKCLEKIHLAHARQQQYKFAIEKLMWIGDLYDEHDLPDKALPSYQKALAYCETISDETEKNDGKIDVLMTLARFHRKKMELTKASEYSRQARELMGPD